VSCRQICQDSEDRKTECIFNKVGNKPAWIENCNPFFMKALKVETHPFPTFIPPVMKCLIVGSFPGKELTAGGTGLDENAWFYGAPLNQLWKILEIVYKRELKDKKSKQHLLRETGIGMADIFQSVTRKNGSNLDDNLEIIKYNKDEIERILKKYHPRVLFTSRFVEKEFKKMFPQYVPVDILPSPSPRYFKLSISQKVEIYKAKLQDL
jgi:hypoxanthine-DNA glycosylase